MKSILHYFSLVKFSHTIFAMPFAVLGYFLGVQHTGESPDWQIFLYVLLCMIFARNAAMGFNRWADRNIDAANERTAVREIPAGKVSAYSALLFVIANAGLFIAATYMINPLCFYLSPVALFTVLVYSFTKRFTALCHFVLGLGLSLAPIGAYIAVTGSFALLPLLFSGIVLLWTGGFDILYSLQDEDFDRDNMLHSMPSLLGRRRALLLSSAVHIIVAVAVATAGLVGHFHPLYWAGAVIFIGLLIYQHMLVTPDDISRVNLAFGTTNGIASFIYCSISVFAILLYS